ncbi:hypothetical protein DFH27DRAFT_613448 [Peziza echinospora]|nr:hypothetical protein DFH27DRAFT_613448 [Peziza echinospora]
MPRASTPRLAPGFTLSTRRTFILPGSEPIADARYLLDQTNEYVVRALNSSYPASIQPTHRTHHLHGYNTRSWFLSTGTWSSHPLNRLSKILCMLCLQCLVIILGLIALLVIAVIFLPIAHKTSKCWASISLSPPPPPPPHRTLNRWLRTAPVYMWKLRPTLREVLATRAQRSSATTTPPAPTRPQTRLQQG